MTIDKKGFEQQVQRAYEFLDEEFAMILERADDVFGKGTTDQAENRLIRMLHADLLAREAKKK